MADSPTIERDTFQTAATNRLRKLILTYQVKPGERLIQDDLANLLGVSRTPVREAIRQLETEGLITVLPYKGAIVSTVTAEEIEGVYQVRIALESHASRLAARNLQAKDLKVLRELLDEMRQAAHAGMPEASLDANRRFYCYFYSLAMQPRLFDLIVSHLDLSRRFRQQYFYFADFSSQTIHNHEFLLKLMKNGDEVRLADTVAAELQRVADQLLELFHTSNSDPTIGANVKPVADTVF